ncbi:uncharacterized protein LOC131931835 [Physella acuta]|uniref:uncharacterized protein LOC131931835 n=1 Tax=Physella acuta TaxID=109671 RepID=UPI0027DE64A2|nr:uncharacterized protein LOC131931835 [Physella acuta]
MGNNSTKQTDRKSKSCTVLTDHCEAEVCEQGEAELPGRLVSCTKNPGHADFLSVADFSSSHLPEVYQNSRLHDVIDALAGITALIKVYYTSLARPEFHPSTNSPYPCYHYRGSDVLRTGTARLSQVQKFASVKYRHPCRCHKCQRSTHPSRTWGTVEFFTATHIVFDSTEACRATCVLGYDTPDSTLTYIDGWRVSTADVKDDWCVLTCVTCDTKLLERLQELKSQFNQLCWREQGSLKSLEEERKLTIIVSHPHGGPKRISLGRQTQRLVQYNGGHKCTKYTYTTGTCPGSSGAPVYTAGEERFMYPLAHSGAGPGGNYSGNKREPSGQ